MYYTIIIGCGILSGYSLEIEGKLIRSTVDGRTAYTFGTLSRSNRRVVVPRAGYQLVELRGSLDDREKRSCELLLSVIDSTGTGTSLITTPFRWQLNSNHLYLAEFVYPARPVNRGVMLVRRPHEQYRFGRELEDPNAAHGIEDRMRDYEMSKTPLAELLPYENATSYNTIAPVYHKITFDFIVLRDGTVELYVLGQKRVITVWQLRHNRDWKKSQWIPVGAWCVDFAEPFYVFASANDRHIVTESGRLFTAPLPTKVDPTWQKLLIDGPVHGDKFRGAYGKCREYKQVPVGGTIRAVICDLQTDRSYAFTDEKWFALDATIAPKPHSLGSIRTGSAHQALEESIKCGKFIRDSTVAVAPK